MGRLKQLTQNFPANRPMVSKAIRAMYAEDPDGFVKAAVQVLREQEEGDGSRFLLSMLVPRPDYIEILCDPEVFSPAQSAALLRRVKAWDPRAEWKLARLLAGYDTRAPASVAAHCLEVLIHLSADATLLPALRELLRGRNGRVRSKAALLIGHITRNPQWAKHREVHQDGRVTDNAVESVWGLTSPAAKDAFREATTSDRHRAAVNGAVGLYLAREPEAVGLLLRFSRDERCKFRAASAWAMARIGDPRFLPVLASMKDDAESGVRSTAGHAHAVLETRLAQLRDRGVIAVRILTARFHEGEHTVYVAIGEEPAAARESPKLDALHFVVRDEQAFIEEYACVKMRTAGENVWELRFRGVRPSSRLIGVQIFTERGCGEDTGFELAY